VPVEVAAERAVARERQDTSRTRDAFESDDALQARCARVYDELAASHWLSEWRVLDGTRSVAANREAMVVLAKELYLGK
jgi:dTMP kinase